MKNVSPVPAMAALAWLLASNETPEVKIANAISMLRKYGFDESAPLSPPPDSHWTKDIEHDTPLGEQYGGE